jgi:hypothetical protein
LNKNAPIGFTPIGAFLFLASASASAYGSLKPVGQFLARIKKQPSAKPMAVFEPQSKSAR